MSETDNSRGRRVADGRKEPLSLSACVTAKCFGSTTATIKFNNNTQSSNKSKAYHACLDNNNVYNMAVGGRASF